MEGSGPILSKLNFENIVKECVPKIREWLLLFTFFLGQILVSFESKSSNNVPTERRNTVRSKNSQNKRNVLNNYLMILQIDL